MIKIVAVCNFGIGTSLILKLNTEKALQKIDVNATVECSDKLIAPSLPCDLYIATNNIIANELKEEVSQDIVVINNFMNIDEIAEKIMVTLKKMSLIKS